VFSWPGEESMNLDNLHADKKPRIRAISHRRATRLITPLLPHYAAFADIKVIDRTMDEALNAARELERAGDVDVFISGGSNGEHLRNNVSSPVVLIKVSAFDILTALLKAQKVSHRIAIVTYKATHSELDLVKQLLNIELEQRFYTTMEEATACFRELAGQGCKVIVGSSIIVELAEQSGLVGILLYSEESMRQAIDDAIEMARVTKMDEIRRQRLNTILRNLNEGVVAVDMEERIQVINPAMEKLLTIREGESVGMRLSKISDLRLHDTLQRGIAQLDQIQQVGFRTLVTSRIPIFEMGVQTGAVLTCRDSTSIQKADRKIRSQTKTPNLTAKYQLSQILGNSSKIKQAKLLASQYAKTDSTILITGETGTGKELFAQGIHNLSPRKYNPFVALNCAAFPESLLESELFGHEEGAFSGSRKGGKVGLFEAAHTGTIFLDEIGDMPFPLQTRLLRVLQEKEVLRVGSNEPMSIDIRVIAATNRDLKKNVADKLFREDLYYRINTLCINIPPLRERMDDLPLIAAHLLNQSFRRLGSHLVEEKVLESLLPYVQRYSWPGNVRELENVIERLAHYHIDRGLPDTLDMSYLRSIIPEICQGVEELSQQAPATLSLKGVSLATEALHIERLMAECHGNYCEVSRRLGVSRTTLWRKLKTLSGNRNAHSMPISNRN
jgi:propionate catabolism operon transcriptional regulator